MLHKAVGPVRWGPFGALLGAAIRPNPQSALPTMQDRFGRSKIDLRGPGTGLKGAPQSSRRVRSA
eukprot:15460478-Alexandrium_andersonii.AAC.1